VFSFLNSEVVSSVGLFFRSPGFSMPWQTPWVVGWVVFKKIRYSEDPDFLLISVMKISHWFGPR